MIIHKQIDIFKLNTPAMVHQCNLFHTMEGGIAKEIKRIYPEAFLADLETKYGDTAKLGTFSVGDCGERLVYNLYSQNAHSDDDQYVLTNYKALYTGLVSINNNLYNKGLTQLAIPHGIGCGIARGDWNVVNAIINDIFRDSITIIVTICQYTPPTLVRV